MRCIRERPACWSPYLIALLGATAVLAEEPRLTFRGRLVEAESPVVAVAGSADGKRIAVAREDGTVVLAPDARTVTHRLRRADQLAFTPDGSFLVHSRGDELATFELAGGVPRMLHVRGELWALRADTLAVVGSRTIHLLDVRRGTVARSFPIEPLPIQQERPDAVTIAEDGSVAIRRSEGIVVYERDGEMRRLLLACSSEVGSAELFAARRIGALELDVARCTSARAEWVSLTNDGVRAVDLPAWSPSGSFGSLTARYRPANVPCRPRDSGATSEPSLGS